MTAVYPLFFRRDDYITGNGFISLVRSTGRLLLSVEEGGVWVYGVIPCAIAATGATQAAALLDFKENYVTLLRDFARAAADAAAFECQVHAFFDQTPDDIEAEWTAARETVRSHGLELDGLKLGQDAEYPAGVDVFELRDTVHAKPSEDPVFAYADAA